MKNYILDIKTRKPETYTQEDINGIVNLYIETESLKKVADKFNRGQQTIKRILLANDIKVLDYNEYLGNVNNRIEDKREEIIELYCNQRLSLSKVAKKIGYTSGALSTFLRKNNISPHKRKCISQLKNNKQQVINLYKQLRNVKEVARVLNVDSTITGIFLKDSLEDYNGHKKKHSYNALTEQDIIKVRELVETKKMYLNDVGKIYNCTGPTVAAFCKKHNIQITDSAVRSRENGRQSINTTFRRKQYILPESNHSIYIQGYEPQFLDYVFNHNLLKEHEIVYKPEKIKYTEGKKKRYYYPDFYIPKLNLIVEIKSNWILNRQGKRNIKLKEKATIGAGFNYVLILDNDFSAFQKLITDK